MKVTIALCTRKRPEMLKSCLNSIQSLAIPDECSIHVALVENDIENFCESTASEIMKATPHIGFSYGLEQIVGISSARNTSIELALKSKPDWIAFIDDDETVSKDWLQNYVKAILTNSADVYTSSVEYVLLEDAPIWYKKPTIYKFPHMSLRPYAATGNTIANSAFFDGRQKKYRFSEELQLIGSEDTELFSRLVNDGGIIRYVHDADAHELVVKERTSAKWMIANEFSNGNKSAIHHISLKGRMNAVRHFTSDVLKGITKGCIIFIWGILIFPFTMRSLRYIVKGLRKNAWSFGVIAGLFNITYNRYKNIEGY